MENGTSFPLGERANEGLISITAVASVSPLGVSSEEVWKNYKTDRHFFKKMQFGTTEEWAAPLTEDAKVAIDQLRKSDSKYKDLDDTVLFTIYVARKSVAIAGWKSGDNFGINIGSSRGATALFEKYHTEFLDQNRASTLSSPTTTLGNISSWVAHDLQTKGPEISHSITCSTALHALLNGVAWIRSGLTDKFLVGGSEAPLTPFTIAQMKALKVYARQKDAAEGNQNYPCRALDPNKTKNSMVLGEGAAVVCLEAGLSNNALAVIEGIGYATEVLKHNVSISSDAECFQRSMKMALGNTSPKDVDIIVMHAPGTIKGDSSEYNAIKKVFGEKMPALTTNKWKIGHTFGASGMLSLELAVLMLQKQEFIKVPFIDNTAVPSQINKVMVNAVGFGGNAVSVLFKSPSYF